MKKTREDYDRVDQAMVDIIHFFKTHKKQFIKTLGYSFIISCLVSSLVYQYFTQILFRDGSINYPRLLIDWITTPISLFIIPFSVFVCINLAYKVLKLRELDYIDNKEEGYKESKSHEYGDAHWATEKEKLAMCDRAKEIEKLEGDVLGYDENGYKYALKRNLLGINQNKIAFGAAGSGKSAAIVYNDIYSCFKRGESLIVTDSKGDVFKMTAKLAKKYGYCIRVLNLKPKELKYSDAWEPLKYVTAEDEIQAEVLAKAIINNTQDGARMDYWANNEMNCLKAAILLVATTENYKDNRSMEAVVDVVSNPESFDEKFTGLPNGSPALNAFNIYAACKDDVKKQILNGMAIRLSLLNNEYVKNIVSHDEIDLIAPMQKKCIYYIIISDTDNTMKFVTSMFFTQIFMLQCDYSDGLDETKPDQYGITKKSQIPVRYELDEFKNIGKIPDFEVKISTFRSRKIASTIILQNVSQLYDLYPNKLHETILGNTSTHILLKAGDMETANYFSKLCGELTIKVEGGGYRKNRSQALDMHDQEKKSNGLGKRYLLMPDKARRLDADTIIVSVTGFQPLKLKKFIAERDNPEYKDIEKISPTKHIPKWRIEKAKREQEAEELFQQSKRPKVAVTLESEKDKVKEQSQGSESKPQNKNSSTRIGKRERVIRE